MLLSDQLQSVQNDLASAIDLVNATKQTLQEYRSDAMWVKIWGYANRIAEVHDIDVEYPSGTSRRRRPPKRFEETVILESVGARESLSSGEQYKRELYFPVLDAILAELSRRLTARMLRSCVAFKHAILHLMIFCQFQCSFLLPSYMGLTQLC